MIEFVQRQGDKGAGCRELSKPWLSRPKCVCTGMVLRVCVSESLTKPALSCRSKEGWVTGLRFLCRVCPEVPRHSGVGHQPQGQCESLTRPAFSCRSKEGWGTGLRFVDRWQLIVFKMNLAIQMKQGSPSWRADKSCLRKLTPLTQSTQSTQSRHWIHSTHSTHSALLTLPPLSLSVSLSLSLSLSLKRVSLQSHS